MTTTNLSIAGDYFAHVEQRMRFLERQASLLTPESGHRSLPFSRVAISLALPIFGGRCRQLIRDSVTSGM